jgi:hypothetical protein
MDLETLGPIVAATMTLMVCGILAYFGYRLKSPLPDSDVTIAR